LIEEPEQPDAPEERPPEQPEEPQAEEPQAEEPQAEEPQAEEPTPEAEEPAPEAEAPTPEAEEPQAEQPEAPEPEAEDAAPVAEAAPEERGPRGKAPERGEKKDKPEVIPGEHLTPDISLGPEGTETDIEKLFAEQPAVPAEYAPDEAPDFQPEPDEAQPQAAPRTPVEIAAEARYRATGKRKTSVARVILRPGKGSYTINGRPLDAYFPRPTLQHTARQPLETAGYQESMDVVAKIHGGGVSAQADALRHGIARALIEVDPQLRTDLKRRGFLTRDARAKERKKAGLKKARKRPQFSKR
jgi:small subunit ribosomal protein S9